jgi:hypothetical protein
VSEERRGRAITLNSDAVVASLQSIINERDRLNDEIGRLAEDIEVWKARCQEALERPGCARCEALESERDRARDALEGKVWEPTLEVERDELIEALKPFARCKLYGHTDDTPRRRVDCADDQCRNPTCTTYVECTARAHGVRALLDRLSPQEPAKAAGPKS